MRIRAIANTLRICSAVVIVLFWGLLLTPTSWNVKFPGEVTTTVIVLAAPLASIFACLKGSRWWLIVFIGSLLTSLLLLFGRV